LADYLEIPNKSRDLQETAIYEDEMLVEMLKNKKKNSKE